MLRLNRDTLVDADTRMRTIRDFEDRVHTEFATGAIPGFVHLYAGEARTNRRCPSRAIAGLIPMSVDNDP